MAAEKPFFDPGSAKSANWNEGKSSALHGGWPSCWNVAYASLRAGRVCAHACDVRAQRRRRRADVQYGA